MKLFVFVNSWILPLLSVLPAMAQSTIDTTSSHQIEISPKVIQESPVLQEWLKEIPNVWEEIKHDPAFKTRLRLGYSTFPSSDDTAGVNVGIEDILLGNTGLTISADYYTNFESDRSNSKRHAFGADLHYFVLPLGSYVNFAPLVGYRYVESNNFSTDGVHLGLRLILPLSRNGGGDLSVSQSFISPGSDREVGITSLAVGYALTSHLRLSADIEQQNSLEDRDRRFGLNLEWLLY